MADPIDFRPAAERMASVVAGIPDGALGLRTPCTEYTVGDLLDHVGQLAPAFAGAARKSPLGSPPAASAANLEPGWRDRIAADLDALADAWRDPAAWEGMTAAGGVDLPGEVAGIVALDELVVHGWDLAVATGQPSGYDGPGAEAVLATLQQLRAGGIEIFGPVVHVPAGAPVLDRILGEAGRHPGWRPA